jgi:hypothetical protein
MATDACLTCGHSRAFHQNAAGAADRCHLIGCTCTKFEQADPKFEQATCLCGHPEHPDHDTEEPARICRTCQREDRHPAGCWGLFPQGSVAIEVDEHGQPVGDDLHQAIQAAAEPTPVDLGGVAADLRSIAAKGAWGIPELAAERIVAVTPDLVAELQASRDRHADLEVQVAELRDLLARRQWGWQGCHVCGEYFVNGHLPDCRIAAALQADGPARGHAILAEVERLREAIREALPHVPYRVEQDLRDALDQAAQREAR